MTQNSTENGGTSSSLFVPDFLLLNHPCCISPTSKKGESLSLLLPSAVPMQAQIKHRAQGWSVLTVTEKSTGYDALK